MQVSDLQVCVKSRGVGREVLWDSVRVNFLSLRRLSAGMFLKIQVDISSQFKWACPKLSCYMRDLVHFACKLNFFLPESYLPVIIISSQFKWACPKLSCYMRDLVHFACKLNFCLPESYLPVISVRICKNVPARTGPEAGHRPASGLCGSPNLRGLAVKDQSVS